MQKGHYQIAPFFNRERAMNQHQGFTLIELMIAVAVVGILAAIAYPSYMDSIRKARRADAKSALLDAVHRQERFFTENNQYTNVLVGPSGCTGSACGLGLSSATTTDGYYTLALNAVANAAGRISAYTITATPFAGKSQTKDTTCGAATTPHFQLNQQNVKCVQNGTHCSNGNAADQAAVAACW